MRATCICPNTIFYLYVKNLVINCGVQRAPATEVCLFTGLVLAMDQDIVSSVCLGLTKALHKNDSLFLVLLNHIRCKLGR